MPSVRASRSRKKPDGLRHAGAGQAHAQRLDVEVVARHHVREDRLEPREIAIHRVRDDRHPGLAPALDLGVLLLDPGALGLDSTTSSNEEYFIDNLHLSAEGHRYLAERLARELRAHGLL